MRQLVIGAGEVGASLARVLGCDLRDVEPHNSLYDVLHICFPWSDQFVEEVWGYIEVHDPEHVVIHSTVPVGTCAGPGWIFSPVSGRHPDLDDSLRTFPKPVAGPGVVEVERVVALLRSSEVPAVRAEGTTSDLEASKLVDLLVYGANIRIAKEVERMCRERGLDYDHVLRASARRYNAGYAALGEDQFRRFDLAHMPGGLGGHCVGYPNIGLIDDDRLEELIRPITKEHWDDALD